MGKSRKTKKEQQLRDYAGWISAYSVIVTIILVIILLKQWFGIDVLAGIGGLLGKAEGAV